MKVGILGAGQIAAAMAATLNGMDDEYQAYAIASRTLAKAEAFAAQWHIPHAYGSYEEMLQDPEVDLVYIATPHALHNKHAELCIRYHKPALVEKPFCCNKEQAEKVFADAEKEGVFITEAMWTRYMPGVSVLRDLIQSGRIGKVHMIRADVSYPMQGKARLNDPSLGGGALLDVGIYALHFAMMLRDEMPLSIDGSCTKTDTGVDSQENMTLTYKDGMAACLTSSMEVSSPLEGIIQGEKGRIRVKGPVSIKEIEVCDHRGNVLLKPEIPPQITGYEYEVEACAEALKAGHLQCDVYPHEETVKILEVMDRLREKWGIRYPFEQ